MWLRDCIKRTSSQFSEEDVARAELGCTEIFTNCAVHAGDARISAAATNPVMVDCRLFPDFTTVEFRHRGPLFDPLTVPPPAFDGSRDGGFGIYIVLRSADDARFVRESDGTNVTTLSFLSHATEKKR